MFGAATLLRQKSLAGWSRPVRLLSSLRPSSPVPELVSPASLIEGNPLAMWIHDIATSRLVEGNERALLQYGYVREEFLALSITDLWAGVSYSPKIQPIRPNAPAIDAVHTHVKKDGTQIEVMISANDIVIGGRPCQFVVAEDVTERRNTQNRLIRLAHHDALTGLPNRVLLVERLTQVLLKAKEVGHRAAVICIDLDRFKQVNDTYGHAVGDECLKEIGATLTGRLRGMDTVARTGGEEFTAILGEVESVSSALLVGKALLQAFSKPLEIEGHRLHLGGSIGIAVYPDHGEEGQELCRSADAAMYRAKRAGGKRCILAGPDMSTAAEDNAALDKHVREMLNEGRLRLEYQLQYGPGGVVRGMEALLRLPDVIGGYVSPDRFVPQAEENGLIHPIGRWVIEEACRQLAAWNIPGRHPLRVAVNVSPSQLMRSEFAAEVETSLTRWGVNPSWLEMEVTERVMLNFDEIGKKMRDLYAIGIRFAVDDFGVGYSSLEHLHRLPISTLKIDRSFVQRLCDPAGSYPIVQAIIAMGHSLDMEVISEGVESEQQRTVLEQLGCDALQGFLFSRPASAQAITDLLSTRS